MNGIIDTDTLFKEFDFKQLQLTKPIPINNGNYFMKCSFNNNPLYIQPPKCTTKQGITKIGRKYVSDLVFTNENECFLTWIENLENHCQSNIYDNRESWFDTDLDKFTIEDYFTNPIKVYKSGKYYLLRVNIQSVLDKPAIKFYDDNENNIDYTTISDKNNLMSILEVKGIKCSATSFQIELDLKQVLVMQDTNIFEKCLLKTNNIETKQENTNANITEYLEKDEGSSIEKDIILNEENQIDVNCTIIDNTPISEEKEHNSTDIQVDTSYSAILGEKEDVEDVEDVSMNSDIDNNIRIEPTTIEEHDNMNDIMEIVDLNVPENVENSFQLKQRNEVYYEMYREARKKAKVAKEFALHSYLEAKRIKNTYMLENIDDSSDSEIEDEN